MIDHSLTPQLKKHQQPCVSARNGMVITGSTPAALAGLEVLQAGGNAIDAAIATAAALTVSEPTGNGLGSGMHMIAWVDGTLIGLNASGTSPASCTLENVLNKYNDISSMPKYDWTPVLVPGAVKGWEMMHQRFGKLPFKQCLDPAIGLAEDGFVVGPMLATMWQRADQHYRSIGNDDPRFRAWFDTFSFDGQPPKVHDIVRLKDHAATLKMIADHGSHPFYQGKVAHQIAAESHKFGGFITYEDLANYQAEWVDPIIGYYRGYQIAQIPPNTQGILVLMALNILEQLSPPASMSNKWMHQQIEAIKIAFADGFAHIADLKHMKKDMHDFLDDHYGKEKATWIKSHAQTYTDQKPHSSGTVYLATADRFGNMVSLIQSNYTGFGSGMVVPNTGIALNNRGACFSLDPKHPNAVGPHKKAYDTIIPGFLLKDDVPIGPFGLMGGYMQPQGHVQLISNMIDFHQNPQTALNQPRWQWLQDAHVIVESTFSRHLIRQLRSKGHDVKVEESTALFGRGQIIQRLDNGTLIGAKEPRTDSHIACF